MHPLRASLLTIVRNRHDHLRNLIRGVNRLTERPTELIIVHMNEDPLDEYPDAGCPIVSVRLNDGSQPIPLSRARNRAAELATEELLVFLDVDCIPSSTYITDMRQAVRQTNGLVMGTALYLPVGSGRDDWSEKELASTARHHPRRPRLDTGETRPTDEYHLFWSLTFGCYARTFAAIGGFDENYRGYGGEDTDFAFRARRAGVPFSLTDARAYHQHHSTTSPPFGNMRSIVVNSQIFKQKWGVWPMTGWLEAFREAGYVRWTDDELELLRLPDAAVVEAHRSTDPFA